MYTLDAIVARRSVRNFKNIPVAEETLQAILAAAIQAPSPKTGDPGVLSSSEAISGPRWSGSSGKGSQLGRLAPLAGVPLLEALPMYGVLAVDIITAVVAVGCLVFIAILQPERTALIAKASPLEHMEASYRYVWQNAPGLVMSIAMFAAASLQY